MEECQRGEGIMMNFNNKRTRKIVSSVIIILLVLAEGGADGAGSTVHVENVPLSGGQ